MKRNHRDGASAAADEELVALYRRGDDRALETLLAKYRTFARLRAQSYFLLGADRDDIVQEGMIGLYKAIRDYDPGHQTTFRGFAEVCITRQIITAVKSATRQKHAPLNAYQSLSNGSGIEGEDAERPLEEIVPTAEVADPLELIVAVEDLDNMRMCFAEILSSFESTVLHLYMEGKTYHDIGRSLGRPSKSIDNALQRIKRKIELQLRSRQDQGI